MNTDTFFTKGVTHPVCEDYALGNRRDRTGIKGVPFIVVCDGCSGSDDSDFGARILARSALPYMARESDFDHGEFCHGVVGAGAAICRALNLNLNALTATLLAAKVVKGEFVDSYVQVWQYGDGVIAAKKKDGSLKVSTLEFTKKDDSPAGPYYPRYEIDPVAKKAYFEKFGMYYAREELHRSPEGVWSRERHRGHGYDIHKTFHMSFPVADYEYVALFSDGIIQFMHTIMSETGKLNEQVPLEMILDELLAFSDTKGTFVQRRCKKAFSRRFAKEGWFPSDDFSMGVITLEE